MRLIFVSILSLILILGSCNSGKTWDQVKQENSLETYEVFLNNNPDTEYKDSILMFIKELEWQKIKEDTVQSLIDEFRTKYPDDEVYADSLERIQVAIAWKEALEKHTIEGYEAFLEKYSSTSYKYSAKGKIEEIRWSEAKKSADKKQIIDFLADYTLANYLDSIDFKMKFSDFKGYMIEFEANDEDGTGKIFEKLSISFHSNGKITGNIEGEQEGQNYYNSWSSEIRGEYDEEGLRDMESRFLGMSDEVDSKPDENWMDLDLFYDEEMGVFVKDKREFKLKEISRIEEK